MNKFQIATARIATASLLASLWLAPSVQAQVSLGGAGGLRVEPGPLTGGIDGRAGAAVESRAAEHARSRARAASQAGAEVAQTGAQAAVETAGQVRATVQSGAQAGADRLQETVAASGEAAPAVLDAGVSGPQDAGRAQVSVDAQATAAPAGVRPAGGDRGPETAPVRKGQSGRRPQGQADRR